MSIKTHKRILSLDILRSIAIIMVIMLHVTLVNSYAVLYRHDLHIWNNASLIDKISFCFFNGIGASFGVPIFVMLTGYLMLDRCYDVKYVNIYIRRNVLPMFVAYEIWTVIQGVVDCYPVPTVSNIVSVIKACLFLGKAPGVLWFMQMMIGLYLGIPLLATCLKWISDNALWKYAKVVFLCIFIGLMVVPNVADFLKVDIQFTLDLSLIGADEYVVLLLVGYAIKKRVLRGIADIILCLMLLCSLVITCLWRGLIYSDSILHNAGTYSNPFSCIAAAVVFELMLRHIYHEGMSSKVCNSIENVSKYSFGIYASHLMLISILNKVVFNVVASVHNSIVETFIDCVVVFVINYCIIHIFRKNTTISNWILLMR